MRRFLPASHVLVLFATNACAAADKPGILVIMSDDVGITIIFAGSVRNTPLATHTGVEACARCDSRRSLLLDPG